MSVYIPRLYCTLLEDEVQKFVKSVFLDEGYGNVTRVDLHAHTDYKNGSTFYQAYVYLEWFETDQAKSLQETIEASNQYRIYLEQGTYWIVLKNTNPITEEEVEINKEIRQMIEQQMAEDDEEVDVSVSEMFQSMTMMAEAISEMSKTIERMQKQIENLEMKGN
jgi:hypothetical protein